MKKRHYLLVLLLVLLAQPILAQDKNTAKMLIGEWRCTQSLSPEQGIHLNIEYTQHFTHQRHFTLNGSIEMKFSIPEMNAMFGGDSLKYLFEGNGRWSTQPNRLIVKTENTKVQPNSPMAQQMQDAGIMDLDDLRDIQSEDAFIINNLSKNSLQLTHAEENFTTQCARTQ